MSQIYDSLDFNFPTKKSLKVKFSGVDLSSDGGLLLVKQAEQNLKICEGIANCLEDKRELHKVVHPLLQLISQRVYQIVAGYEDVNDSNYLRHDSIFKTICGKEPIVGEELLASQPTISRLENQVNKTEVKAIRSFFVDKFISSYSDKPEEITLDIDGWDALTYGHQQLSLFHGYYGHKIYYPILINEAKSGYPLIVQLRAGNSHPGKGILSLLRWLFWRLRKAWVDVKITLRGDSGFSLPEIRNLCERLGVKYCFGYGSNAVLKRKIDYLLDQARLQYFKKQEKVRLFDDVYYKAGSWKTPCRIIMKAEWLALGGNPRFLLTNMEGNPQEIYDNFYVKRGGASEQRIKELKLGIKAKRLSCKKFIANQFRLFMAQAAYILMLEIRQAAQGTVLEKALFLRLRETLIKIGAKIRVNTRKILVELAKNCPIIHEFKIIAQKLCQGKQLIFS